MDARAASLRPAKPTRSSTDATTRNATTAAPRFAHGNQRGCAADCRRRRPRAARTLSTISGNNTNPTTAASTRCTQCPAVQVSGDRPIASSGHVSTPRSAPQPTQMPRPPYHEEDRDHEEQHLVAQYPAQRRHIHPMDEAAQWIPLDRLDPFAQRDEDDQRGSGTDNNRRRQGRPAQVRLDRTRELKKLGVNVSGIRPNRGERRSDCDPPRRAPAAASSGDS